MPVQFVTPSSCPSVQIDADLPNWDDGVEPALVDLHKVVGPAC